MTSLVPPLISSVHYEFVHRHAEKLDSAIVHSRDEDFDM